jgi:molybdopterin synthase sulfur carrier subunit
MAWTGPTSCARSAAWAPSVAEPVGILVRYFASAAEVSGREEEVLPSVVLASGSFLVDGVVSRDDSRALGARVDVLPPFAGG